MTDATQLWIEEAGTGQPGLVFVHAGIAESSMWDREFARLSGQFQVVRYDVRGYGRSPEPTGDYLDHEDLADVLAAVGLDAAVIVGASNGGRIALDLAVEHPERVLGLALVGPSVPGVETPDDLRALFDAEAAALEAGDIEAAIDVNLRAWVAGPQRAVGDVDADVVEQVRGWLADLLPREAADRDGEAQLVEPLVRDRLDTIAVPTAVIVGTLDQPKVLTCADLLTEHIADVVRTDIDGAAHLPNLEQPEAFAAALDALLVRI